MVNHKLPFGTVLELLNWMRSSSLALWQSDPCTPFSLHPYSSVEVLLSRSWDDHAIRRIHTALISKPTAVCSCCYMSCAQLMGIFSPCLHFPLAFKQFECERVSLLASQPAKLLEKCHSALFFFFFFCPLPHIFLPSLIVDATWSSPCSSLPGNCLLAMFPGSG